MITFTSVEAIRITLDQLKESNKTLAFVPTMGALHKGHLSLIDKAKNYADSICASIFVNPTQFNNSDDLAKYPRTLDDDKKMLEKAGCNFLFAPEVKEVYPDGIHHKVKLNLFGMDKVMEGEFRPGHFEGMLQVVKRLLDIIQPQFLIMGQKDYQQFSLVNQMILQLKIPTQLVIAPTIREKDGLAMSSRNRRLSPTMRKKSTVLFKSLNHAKDNLEIINIRTLESHCREFIEEEGMRVEYFEIVDAILLSQVKKFNSKQKVVACVAAWADEVRLIDNMLLN